MYGSTCDIFCYRRIVYGFNNIPVEVQSLLKLLLLEVINPFYIFQLFTLCVWAAEGYYYYLIAIVLMTSFGVSSTIIQTRKVSATQGGIQDFHFILSRVPEI
jgi:cation-transporting ATPase 13A3/4/5